MTDLELYLDWNMIYRKDGSFVLNMKHEDFVKGIQDLIDQKVHEIVTKKGFTKG